MLPLFHGHGLNATLLASLAAGASVVCTPGCDVNSFLCVADRLSPDVVLRGAYHASGNSRPGSAQSRASGANAGYASSVPRSAPLPPSVLARTGGELRSPVIEYYGMTETASSPIACNPLPPRQRKAGSVGIPVGLDVAIMDEGGALLPGGQTGEVVVRGASVMSGYDGDPNGDRGRTLRAIGSRQGTSVSSMMTGTCFSPAAYARSSIAVGRKSPHRKSTKCSWNIRRWQRP